MAAIEVSRKAARRYLLGRPGLWSGRRWVGKEGAAAAIGAIEALQVDPVTVVARSHDLVLASRVDGYRPAQLDELAYRERRFFDYGGHLDIYPMAELVEGGEAAVVAVAGVREPYDAPAGNLSALATLESGGVPAAWQPVGAMTDEEVTLLSSLDNLLARRRTRAIFDFDNLWEIYKPAPALRWGRYTLPVLHGDRLVARLEPRLDRRARVLAVERFWPEEGFAPDADFAAALDRGLRRFAAFNGADRVDLEGSGAWRPGGKVARGRVLVRMGTRCW